MFLFFLAGDNLREFVEETEVLQGTVEDSLATEVLLEAVEDSLATEVPPEGV